MKASENVLFSPRVMLNSSGNFNREVTADLFVHKDFPSGPMRSAIVFLHGGCWRFGSATQFYTQSEYLAEKHHFVCLNVDYRMSAEAIFPAALIDAKRGIKWLRQNSGKYNIDVNRIAVCGGSSGANIASLVSTTRDVKEYEPDEYDDEISSEANAAILFNGEFDMWDLARKGSMLEAMKAFLGGTPEEMPERYDEISSIKWINSETCPTLLLHGTRDDCVSHEQSVAYYNKLKSLGVHSEIELYQGKPHAWFNLEPDKSVTLRRMEEFLLSVFRLDGGG